VKVVKNKLAPPFKSTEFDIMYGYGISYVGDILDTAVEADIIQKSGSWFSYGDERIGQGRENAKTFLEQNKEILEKIEKQVKVYLGLEKKVTEPAKS
ncbi:MAG: DNA recombination/repair protein RecA, partial [Candidatus Marinimicrobia bacterium]|nr:DNA recombination/repair protein RecA [Candidatus Neomarinimicrobiota bacterium]